MLVHVLPFLWYIHLLLCFWLWRERNRIKCQWRQIKIRLTVYMNIHKAENIYYLCHCNFSHLSFRSRNKASNYGFFLLSKHDSFHKSLCSVCLGIRLLQIQKYLFLEFLTTTDITQQSVITWLNTRLFFYILLTVHLRIIYFSLFPTWYTVFRLHTISTILLSSTCFRPHRPIIRRSKLYMQPMVFSPSADVFVVWPLRKDSFLNGRTTKTSAEGENTIGCMYNLDLLMMGLWGLKYVEERG